MPIFDFECRSCGHKFDLMISNAEKDKAKCPQCGAMDLKQLLTSFFSSTASPVKTAPIPEACSGCGAAGTGG